MTDVTVEGGGREGVVGACCTSPITFSGEPMPANMASRSASTFRYISLLRLVGLGVLPEDSFLDSMVTNEVCDVSPGLLLSDPFGGVTRESCFLPKKTMNETE